jgi:hypothetical protein
MANHDNLTPAQQAEFDRLMTIKMSDWPDGLHEYVRSNGPIYSGDHMAHVVTGWVREQPEVKA